MDIQLTDNLKAILIKVATELKKYKWSSNVGSNEINLFQNHLEMETAYVYDGRHELPDVNVEPSLDLTFRKNEQNNVYFLVYKTNVHLWIKSVGGTDQVDDGDIDVSFTDVDVSNNAKITQTAALINTQVKEFSDTAAYKYAQESYSEWKFADTSKTDLDR
jgi:hypothetical protein